MRLISLTLENFQGVKHLMLTPNGKDLAIFGDNGTGKTTVFNAFTWLLFDKASTGAKSFSPKTRDKDGELHGLDHTVTAVFEHGGRRFSLTKTFREVYKKKRGSIHEEFDGHTTEFFVDGVPVKEKQYAETVGNLWNGDAELARILTIPGYFAESLPWEKRRALLLEMCGDVEDADVFARETELDLLANALEGRTVEDLGKIVAAKKSAINKRLSDLPGRLDEAQRMAETDGADINALQAELDKLEEEKAILIEERASIAGAATSQKRAEIAELEAEMAEAAAAYRASCIDKSADAKAHLAELMHSVNELREEVTELRRKRNSTESRRDEVVYRRKAILKEYEDALALTFDEGATICPCCNRPLPEDEVEKLREDFNVKKSERLASINEKGKREASREMISALDLDIASLDSQIKNLCERLEAVEDLAEMAKKDVPTFPTFDETEEHREIAARIAAKRSELSEKVNTYTEALSEHDAKIYAAGVRVNVIRDEMAKYNAAMRAQKRVDELLEEQKNLAAEFEEAERLAYLCDLFVRIKSSMLTEKINERFKTVRFSLFAEQINGGIKDECEALVPSQSGALVPFAFANNAARINAGIEIIETISVSLGISLPLFIDNAESVTHIADTSAQKILLVVSEKDKSLRAEVLC